MSAQVTRVVTISSFNIDNFGAVLENHEELPKVQVVGSGFGQVRQALLDSHAACWSGPPDAAVVWTTPEAVSPAFGRLRGYEAVPLAEVLAEVDEFADLIAGAADRVGSLFVPTWTITNGERGLGPLDFRERIGISNVLSRMNLRLAEDLSNLSSVYLLESSRWFRSAGRATGSPKLWYMAKVPHASAVFEAAAADVKAALRSVSGEARKLLILDLDDTLWGGIVGDDGWENLRLGGHSPEGEAFVDFQHALKSLRNRGILLGIVSKNTEEVALEAIRKHPEMVLSLEDFAGWRINWADKARNIAELVEELNLGMQSSVFVDDNPAERSRASEAFPELLVPNWPDDPMLYRRALTSMTCFDAVSLTSEDRLRTQLYRVDAQRDASRKTAPTLEDWLRSLAMVVRVEELDAKNRTRTVQLLNKTNQMNLQTRRLTESELETWVASGARVVRAFSVSDRFGDAGITGILSLDFRTGEAVLTDFVLSCRVFGRQVEETMMAEAVALAREGGVASLVAEFRPTAKNRPCLEFLKRSGLEADSSLTCFRWDLADEYDVPAHVQVVGGAAAGRTSPMERATEQA